MKAPSSRVAVGASIATAIVAFAPTLCEAQQQITVAGYVRLHDGKELKGVEVRVWRNGRSVADTTTGRTSSKSDGYYEVPVPAKDPIDSITFDPPDLVKHGPMTLQHLSGMDQQNLSVVIHENAKLVAVIRQASETEKLDVTQVMEQMDALVTIYFLETDADRQAGQVREKYGPTARLYSRALALGPDAVAGTKWRVLTSRARELDLLYTR